MRSRYPNLASRISILASCILLLGLCSVSARPLPDQQKPTPQIKIDHEQTPIEKARDPLKDVTELMGGAAEDLGEKLTNKVPQQKQEDALAALDKLIAEMEKQCSSCKSGSGNAGGANPTKPLSESRIVGGPGGQGDLITPKDGGGRWGRLPDKDRDRIQQARSDGFPPSYKGVLESYYRHLASEKKKDDAGNDSGIAEDE
jgi:hypothetical protein